MQPIETQHGAPLEAAAIHSTPPSRPAFVTWLEDRTDEVSTQVEGFSSLQDAINRAREYDLEPSTCSECAQAHDAYLHVGTGVGDTILGGNRAYWEQGKGSYIDADACDGWHLCRSSEDGSISLYEDRHCPYPLEFTGPDSLTKAIAAAVEFAQERFAEHQEANPLEVYDDDEEDEWAMEQFNDPGNLDSDTHFVWIVGREDLVRNSDMIEEGWSMEDEGIVNRVSCADLLRFSREHGNDMPAIEACFWNADDPKFNYAEYNARYPYSAELDRRYDAVNCDFAAPHAPRYATLVGPPNPDDGSNVVRLPVIPICHKCGHTDVIGKRFGKLCSNCDPETTIDDLVAMAYPWRHGVEWNLIVGEGQPVGAYATFQEGCQGLQEWARNVLDGEDIDTFETQPNGEPDARDTELWLITATEDSEGVKEAISVCASDALMRDECAAQAAHFDAYAQWLIGHSDLHGI